MLPRSLAALLLSLAVAPSAHGDANAPRTLGEMVELMENGRFENNFFTNDLLKGKPQSRQEEVGACLLDKALSLVTEDDLVEKLNDIQVDLASCCVAHNKRQCIADAKVAYHLLSQAKEDDCHLSDLGEVLKPGGAKRMLQVTIRHDCLKDRVAGAAGMLLEAAKKRIPARSRLSDSAMDFVKRCGKAPLKCMTEVMKDVEERAAEGDEDTSAVEEAERETQRILKDIKAVGEADATVEKSGTKDKTVKKGKKEKRRK